MVTPGSLVEFFQDRRVLCGLCLKADKKGIHVLSEENREVGLSESRVLLMSPNFTNPANLREEIIESLREASDRRESAKKGVSLADLWELLSDDARKYTLEEMTSVYFGSEITPESLSGMARSLREDRLYFERKGDQYRPNDTEHVQEVLQSIRAEAEKEIERAEMSRWYQQLWLGSRTTPPECAERYLRFLKECAIHGPEAGRYKEMMELLKRAGIGQNDAAFQILVKAGVWDADENILMHKFQVVPEFPPPVLIEAEEMLTTFLEEDGWRQGREDLTSLRCVTVDDEYTTEMDDALSLQREGDGTFVVGIHIADAAAFVQPGTLVDREAVHRATSLYFPDRKVRMLPPAVSEQICSLQHGKDRPAVSILVRLDDGGNILDSRITTSLLRVDERLDYYELNNRFGQDQDFDTLLHLARQRRDLRLKAGALHIPFPKVEVHVTEDRQVLLQRDDADMPSQVLVSEFMILGNLVIGELCRSQGIPAVYRSQDAPTEPIEIPENFGPLDGYRIRRFLRKGDLGTSPARHHGLGVEAYVQFTSPIRRYMDLVMHRQVKHALQHGVPMYTKEELDALMAQIGSSLEAGEFLERSRRTYWILKSLEANLWQCRDAVVLQVMHDRYIVQIQDCLYFTDCQPRGDGNHPVPGEVIPVKVELVWPREGVVRLTPG